MVKSRRSGMTTTSRLSAGLRSLTYSQACCVVCTLSTFINNELRYNQQYFNITTSTFLKRLFNPFIFWNNRFLQINEGLSEHYGNLWLILTYAIILGLASNLNRFFIESANFKLEYEMFLRSLGAAIVFFISEPLIYASVLSCLGSYIMNNQVTVSLWLVTHDFQLLNCALPVANFVLLYPFTLLAYAHDSGGEFRSSHISL